MAHLQATQDNGGVAIDRSRTVSARALASGAFIRQAGYGDGRIACRPGRQGQAKASRRRGVLKAFVEW